MLLVVVVVGLLVDLGWPNRTPNATTKTHPTSVSVDPMYDAIENLRDFLGFETA